jgi:hypothetical protein
MNNNFSLKFISQLLLYHVLESTHAVEILITSRLTALRSIDFDPDFFRERFAWEKFADEQMSTLLDQRRVLLRPPSDLSPTRMGGETIEAIS